MALVKLQGPEEQLNGVFYEYDNESTPLGEGAMGRVYKGYCVNEKSKSKTPVAIKAIFDNIPDRVIERARREAAVRIDSPYLLHMLGFVEMPFTSTVNGQTIRIIRYFVVMELLSGVTLYDLVQGSCSDKNGNSIPAVKKLHDAYITDKYSAIQRIMAKVLRGVMALHNANFIHRDIDPSNIMITSEGHIKLIDFGICKPINSLGTIDQNLTSTGVFMGKVNYAAPELVIGDVAHQGPTTDIYALGILLFQLCTGHLPFTGDDNDVLLAHMRKPLPLNEVEKRPFRKIVKKATEKSQGQRYNSAEQMLEALESIDFRVTPVNTKLVYGSIAIAALVAVIITIVMFLPNKSSEPVITVIDSTETITPSEDVVTDEIDDSFKDVQRRLWSNDDEEVYEAFKELAKMANDSRNKDAMFEYGLTFSAGNETFDIPTKRQRILSIDIDIERANLWLRRTFEKDPNSYRAIYWLLNNMIAKKKKDESSVITEEISDLLYKFEKLTAGHDDEIVRKYKSAIDEQRPQLSRWNIQ